MFIKSLINNILIKQDEKTIQKIIDGVVSAPKPRSLSQQYLWQSLLNTNIDNEIAKKLNNELDKLRNKYNCGLIDGPVPSSRKELVLKELDKLKINAYIVTITDEFQGEYMPDTARRLYWLTGFSGSAGFAVIGKTKSVVFSDGRYTVQLAEQVNTNDYELCHSIKDPLEKWVKSAYLKGSRIGFNSTTMSDAQAQSIKDKLKNIGIELVPLDNDPVDSAWQNKPVRPISPILEHPLKYAGVSTNDKYNKLKNILKNKGADVAISCLPDCLCWLLNIRGGDVPYTPFVHGYMAITNDEIHLFVDPLKIPSDLKLPAKIQCFDNFYKFLDTLSGKTVLLDSTTAPYKAGEMLRNVGAIIKNDIDICLIPKSCKNKIEIAGARQAHIVDGVAMVKFLYWIDKNVGSGKLTELSCAEKLNKIRFEHPDMRDCSFYPISAFSSNGAICHYRVTEKTSKSITMNNLYLIDSGGQYEYGTTDITRTIAIGNVNSEQRDRFTRVLKGLIALHNIKFPDGNSGINLDIIARQFLYNGGFNFEHGTGHGIGSYLSVHEGPAQISIQSNSVHLKPGMMFSNEPGYYKSGEYGIRIENLIVVKEHDTSFETPMMEFENLTWCPIDTKAIDISMLQVEERRWLNNYHKTTFKKLSAYIDDADILDWLKNATKEI